jgi:hypothetical protein
MYTHAFKESYYRLTTCITCTVEGKMRYKGPISDPRAGVLLSHTNSFPFYLPHMEYEGNIGFLAGKMKKIIADFHVLGLFIAKKHNLYFIAKIIFRLSRAGAVVRRNLYHACSLTLKNRKLKFWLP